MTKRPTKNAGFTLVEMMVALVTGLIALTSIYAISASSNRRFFEQQRVATTQGQAQMALEELRNGIMRAGLFATPNASKEARCDPSQPTMPVLGGGANTPIQAIQYFAGEDTTILPYYADNGVVADRLRILGNHLTNDRYVIESLASDSRKIFLERESQAYRRSFARGQRKNQSIMNQFEFYDGTENKQNALMSIAFASDRIVHIETPDGKHFYRALSQGPGTDRDFTLATALPIDTQCLQTVTGATVSPLVWMEYLVVDPQGTEVPANWMSFYGTVFPDVDDLPSPSASSLEDTNRVLVRRRLKLDGTAQLATARVIAEWVANFEVSFLVDTNSGQSTTPNLTLVDADWGGGPEAYINANPEKIRTIIVDLSLRTPLEDPSLPFVTTDAGVPTRYEVYKPASGNDRSGSARVRHAHIEIPLTNIAARNL